MVIRLEDLLASFRRHGPFTGEELVGQPLTLVREDVVIAAEFGSSFDGAVPPAGQPTPSTSRQRSRCPLAGWVRSASAASGSTRFTVRIRPSDPPRRP